jgi:putative tryptophan/tyrosine transport system substrate-binding protein
VNCELITLVRDIGGVFAMPKIGIMHSGTKGTHDPQIQAFKKGLEWAAPSANATIVDPLYADDNFAKLDTIADSLVTTDKVDVLLAAGGSASSKAAKKATAASGTPVVFTSVANPARPAANMTGICARTSELDLARLELLHELLPGETKFGAVINPSRFNCSTHKDEINNEAAILGLQAPDYKEIDPGAANIDTLIDHAFQYWASDNYKGALVTADPLFNNHRGKVIRAAEAHKIAAIYQWREFAEEGGLMSYGPNLVAAYTLAGIYVGRILGGTGPKDLPVLQLNKFELVINLKTAKALGRDVPPPLLVQADRILV